MRLIFYLASIEIFKIVKRKSLLVLLVLTITVYTLLMGLYINISYEEMKSLTEAPFLNAVGGVIMLTTSIIFLPLWITIFVGQEFSTGHASRFSFMHSRKHYFFSKAIYSILISTLFAILTFLTILISSALIFPSEAAKPDALTFLKMILQIWIVYNSYSLLCLCVVFLVRKALLSTILIYILPQLDNTLYMIGTKIFDVSIRLGPFEMIRGLYSKSIAGYTSVYTNGIFSNPVETLSPIAYVLIITLLSYHYFLRRDLRVMSD